MNVDSENWIEHENKHGFRWLGFQPTSTTVHANQDCVCLCFADEEAGAGVQIVMSHQSFREYMLTLAKGRETIEAKQDEE
jgi:hypothetical protein